MSPISSNPDHYKISPTSKLVAYSRQFSDIPFAQEVAIATHADEVTKNLFSGSNIQLEDIKSIAPFTEARYKSLFHTIKRLEIKQVLELASGVSFRGLAMTDDPEMIYVESDLPGIMEEKKQIIASSAVMKESFTNGRVFFHNVNALSYDDLEKSLQHFDLNKPIAIVHEGLFQYLSFEEKEIMANHIHRILKKYDGVWITPDFHTAEEREHRWGNNQKMASFSKAVAHATNRNFVHNEFKDDQHINDFFNKLGFEIKTFAQIDGSFELTSLKEVHVPEEFLKSLIANLRLWILSISHSDKI